MEFLNASSHVQSYVYPLFRVTDDAQLIHRMTIGTLLYALVIFIYHKPAPYGRHRKASSRGIPASVAWVLQESPSFYVPVLLALHGPSPGLSSTANTVLLGMFVLHYFHRSLIYPLLVRSTNPMPVKPMVAAFITCTYNGVLHGVYFTKYYQYDDAWLYSPLFWSGLVLYLAGMKVNISCDAALRNLRKTPGSGYVIPKGGLFELVSCPNYLGEIVQMWGYAMASCAPPAIAHAVFTSCFLVRRATQTHQWYQDKFDVYPKERRAVLPYLF